MNKRWLSGLVLILMIVGCACGSLLWAAVCSGGACAK